MQPIVRCTRGQDAGSRDIPYLAYINVVNFDRVNPTNTQLKDQQRTENQYNYISMITRHVVFRAANKNSVTLRRSSGKDGRQCCMLPEHAPYIYARHRDFTERLREPGTENPAILINSRWVTVCQSTERYQENQIQFCDR